MRVVSPLSHPQTPTITIPFLLILIIFSTKHFLNPVLSSDHNDKCEGDVIFSYPSFSTASCDSGSSLLCMGTAAPGPGFLNLTTTPTNGSIQALRPMMNKNGRVVHGSPVRAWPASFCTTFTIRILPLQGPNFAGDGMAFVMAQDNHASPSSSVGSYLGLQDQRLSGGKKFQQLAIEFDTYKNGLDPDDNHIAIDTKSVLNSLYAKSLNSTSIYLKSMKEIKVKITYNGWDKQMQVYVGYKGNPLVHFFNYSIKVSKTIPPFVYVGFTAAMGTLCETHQVLDWVFTSTLLPYSTVMDNNQKKVVLKIVLPIMVVLSLFVICLFGFCSFSIIQRNIIRKKERLGRMEDLERQSAVTAPKKFTYKQLAKATKNFSKENLLGTGGFGSVYKGKIVDPPHIVAVKSISANSAQGEREYLAEISIIGRLRHKNILQLQGWCHENEHLLLVYDYMPNKSLHHFLTGGFLDWKTRYKILTGLASALLYLHEECGGPVVHRDVKPSNVMLDSEFNPYLGDFGLARLLKNMGGVTTMVAGTLGYIAPEVSFTGKATTECDVYSFGVVVLEVVCGRRFNNLLGEDCLVDYVWEIYVNGSLVDVVDPKLRGDFAENQATRILSVALACLHLDSSLRPSMRKVLQILMNPDEPLMHLPQSRPSGVYLSFYGFSNPPSVANSTPNAASTSFPSECYNYEDDSNFTDESLSAR